VKGLNLEFKITDERFFAFQSSFTLLNSEYEKPIQWSNDAAENQYTHKFLRTPNYYGNASLDIFPIKNTTVVFTGIYTGPMWVQHYAGYIAEDRLERTPDFFDAGIKCAYDFKFNKKNRLNTYIGVKNVFNSYQSDFDKGVNRDASYVYGPQQPRTFFVGLKYGLN
jgi:outer membrane receptor for ferrienterochelin and colicins